MTSTTLPGLAGLTVTRRFTEAAGPFDGITFVRRPSKIANPDGSVVFAIDAVEVPDFWDQVAVDILASKYFRKAGVPQLDDDGNPVTDDDGNPVLGTETSARQVVLRLANAWRHWGQRGGYFADDADADAFRDEIAYMLIRQMAAPNSPQWFNTGLYEAYGIVEGPEGNSYYDADTGTVRHSEHKYERSAANACFISAVHDTLVGEHSIMRHFENEARLFKAGSGSGANYSTIREARAPLTAGGSSSGLMSFLKVGDVGAGAIKSGGTTRRAAKMVIVDITHPDIEDFIESKVLEERKVAALVAAGYSSDFNGEAYATVAFQNANHSVRIPTAFLDAVDADGDWELTSRVDGSVVKTVRARELWDKLNSAAWSCADPGVQYDDLLNDWNTALDTERVNGTNPCSEYTHVDDTACNLASLNLGTFFDTDAQIFDIDAFVHAARLWTIVLEITVTMSHYPSEAVARKSYAHRTLGLGYANLGAMLMRAGIAYDSDQARAVMGAVTALMHNTAYATSSELAAAVGPCEAYEPNAGSALRVLRNHRRAAYGSLAKANGVAGYDGLHVTPMELDHLVLAHTPFAAMSDAVLAVADAAVAGAELHGLRNMQATVLAPTGTIGLVMSCDTTGVEPDFALVKLKKLAGGGYMRIVNRSVQPALRTLGYTDAQIGEIIEWLLGSQTLGGATTVSAASLLEAGLTADEVAAAELSLPSQSDLTWAFGSHVIGDAAYLRAGLDPADGGDKLLRALGFDGKAIAVASQAICGHLTVEGCPALNPAHLPVFDCAVECGDGTRSIAWEGHIKALAAVAPHISGSVSKTVNMPNSATVEEVAAAYRMGHDMGVKCVALYRDGCKMSQPLNSAKSSADDGDDSLVDKILANPAEIPQGMSPSEFYGDIKPPRFKLPNMRFGPTWRFEVGGEECYLRTGEYPDGTIGEVFIDWGKQGSTMRGITSALSITLSQALQHGVPLTKLVDSLRGHSFEPRGIVAGHDNLKMAESITDAVMRVLGWHYLGMAHLVQVKGDRPVTAPGTPRPSAAAPTVETVAPGDEDATEPEGTRIYGKSCPDCGSTNMIQAGTCATCGDCGSTTGCS